jgi:hypothetical protein
MRCLALGNARGGGVVVQIVAKRFAVLAGIGVLSGAVIGCAPSSSSNPWGDFGQSDDGGGGSSEDAAPRGTEAGGGSSDGSPASSPETGSPGPGSVDSGAPESSTTQDASPPAPEAGVDAGMVTSDDGFGASRTVCINKINALRATDTAVALQPYTLQNTDTLNTCVDTQASTDQSMNSAHYAFINNDPSCTWGNAQGFAQNECEEGYGTSPSGIEQCLQDMWDESLKPNCAGCVGCTAFGGACPNCDYSGTMGYECGHYVNMSAPYFSMVACGFAGAAPSSGDGWAVQNFE